MDTPIRAAVIICTYNRSDDVERCLSSLQKQTYANFHVLVVDASDDDNAKEVVENFKANHYVRIEYIHSNKGLTIQRNKGIQSLAQNDEVVIFIDDDVELMDGYIELVAKTYAADKECQIVGISGNAINEKKRSIYDRMIRNLFLITDNHTGKVLRSGDAGHVFSPENDCATDVLSGCNMSYRVNVLLKEQLIFDERLSGYAYMEDQDFSMRTGRYGKLMQLKEAKLIHHTSPVAREKYKTIFKMYIVNSHYLFMKNMQPSGYKLINYYWRIAGKFLHACVTAIKIADIGPMLGWCSGIYDIMRNDRKTGNSIDT